MQQYLQADSTVTERLAQSATFMKGGKHHAEGSVKKLKKRVADLEVVVQNGGSSTA